MSAPPPISFRLPPEILSLIEELQMKASPGVPMTRVQVMRTAIVEMAERRGIKPPSPPKKRSRK